MKIVSISIDDEERVKCKKKFPFFNLSVFVRACLRYVNEHPEFMEILDV